MKYAQKSLASATIVFFLFVLGYIGRSVASSSFGGNFSFGEESSFYHILQEGETLPKIAEAYKVDVNRLIHLNGLESPENLRTGSKIFIPGGNTENKFLPYLPESKTWKYIVIHHSATERGDAQIFDKGHRLRGFVQGLGYHFVIDNGTFHKRPGQIETGERWYKQMRGAHCNLNGMNEMGIGICLVGNFDEGGVPSEQLASAVWLVKNLQRRYGIPTRQIIRHKDAKKSTHCPGEHFPWENFIRMLD